jgi:AcrR family transcriptional regulator
MKLATLKRGRPLKFDRQEALRAAQRLIWQHGYEAMSLSQLETAMGIGKTSLYAAFGSKHALLCEAAELYISEASAKISQILNAAPTTTEALRQLFHICVADFTDDTRPYGCFLVSAGMVCSAENTEALNFLRQGRAAVGALILTRLERGILAGDMVPDAPVAAIAEYLLTVLHGMSVQARDGSARGIMAEAVTIALSPLDAFNQASR